MHGYDLRKRLREEFGPLSNLSYGSLYPALARLENDGAIRATRRPRRPAAARARSLHRVARRRAGRHGRPSRDPGRGDRGSRPAAPAVARSTRSRRRGEELFDQLLESDAVVEDPRSFTLHLAFARHLTAASARSVSSNADARTSPPASSARAGAAQAEPVAGRATSRRSPNRRKPSSPASSSGSTASSSAKRSNFATPTRNRTPAASHDRRPSRHRPGGHAEATTSCHDQRGPQRASQAIRKGPLTVDRTIKVAIAGVGNCASSMLQGVEYYRDADPAEAVPGLMHVDLGGYHVSDMEFVAAFDVDAEKVGLDLSKAIFSGKNNTIRFADVPDLGVTVERGRRSTGSASTTARSSKSRRPSRSTSARCSRESGAEVLVSYLPVGSEEAQKLLRAGRARRRGRVRQRDPRLHRQRPGVGEEVHRRGRPDRRRRHQEPGRRDDRPPDPRPAVRGPRHWRSTAPTS